MYIRVYIRGLRKAVVAVDVSSPRRRTQPSPSPSPLALALVRTHRMALCSFELVLRTRDAPPTRERFGPAAALMMGRGAVGTWWDG